MTDDKTQNQGLNNDPAQNNNQNAGVPVPPAAPVTPPQPRFEQVVETSETHGGSLEQEMYTKTSPELNKSEMVNEPIVTPTPVVPVAPVINEAPTPVVPVAPVAPVINEAPVPVVTPTPVVPVAPVINEAPVPVVTPTPVVPVAPVINEVPVTHHEIPMNLHEMSKPETKVEAPSLTPMTSNPASTTSISDPAPIVKAEIVTPEPVALEVQDPISEDPIVVTPDTPVINESQDPIAVPTPVEPIVVDQAETVDSAPVVNVTPDTQTAMPESPVESMPPTAQEILKNPEVLVKSNKPSEKPLVEGNEEGKPMKEVPKSTKKKKKSKILLFVLLGVLVLFITMISIGVMMFVSKDGASGNPLLAALGIEAPSLMTFVFLVSSIVLGIFSLIALIAGIVALFKFVSTDKTNKLMKKKSMISMVIAFGLMLVFVVGLVLSSMNLSKYNAAPAEEISVIVTDPVDTLALTTPIEIDFSIADLPIDPTQVEIIGYIWDFGDGERGTGKQIKHTYSQKPADGIYEAQLTIQYKEAGDNNIKTEVYTKTISIENESVAPLFGYDPQEGRVPLEVVFDASESVDPDGEIVMYEWDFDGDGEFEGEGKVTSHVFEENGEFEVMLRITDSNGSQTTTTHPVNAKGEDIIQFKLSLNPDDEILAPGTAYQFDASESVSEEGKIVNYEWIFGDGTRGDGQKYSHAYENEGVYTLVAKLTDEAENVRTFEKEIKVSKSSSGLFARIQTVPEITEGENKLYGTVPFKVNFSGGSSSGGDIVDYAWDFDGDGTVDANGKTIDHIFDKSGTYNVFLTITSADDKEAQETFTVEAKSAGLQAKINANPASGVAPLKVTFDASASRIPDDVEIVSYIWDFGDGTPINKSGARVTHRYSNIGIFNPSLMIVDSNNNHSEVETVININSVPLQACFVLSQKFGPAPLFVEFNPTCSTGEVRSYSWDFGGLGASEKVKPDYEFKVPGTYEITLEVADGDNNIAEFKDTVIVE